MEEGAFEQGRVDIPQAEKGPKHARQRLGQGLGGTNKGVLGKAAGRGNEVRRGSPRVPVSLTPLKSKVGT